MSSLEIVPNIQEKKYIFNTQSQNMKAEGMLYIKEIKTNLSSLIFLKD